MCVEMAEETFAEKVKRLQQEIAVRQAELAYLVLGDPKQSVSVGSLWFDYDPWRPQANDDESTKSSERVNG
jgi:hypothetical protein